MRGLRSRVAGKRWYDGNEDGLAEVSAEVPVEEGGGKRVFGENAVVAVGQGEATADGWAGTTANASEPPVWSRWSWQRSEKGRRAGGQEGKRARKNEKGQQGYFLPAKVQL